MITIWLGLGFLLGGLFIWFVRMREDKHELFILSAGLIGAAMIYILFGALWGDSTWVLIELVGVPIYALFTWAAYRFSYHWLAIGWLLHPVWDVWLHLLGPGVAIAPEWYAIACISFDILMGIYILSRMRTWKENAVLASAPDQA